VNAVVARCAQVRSCISERGARSAGRVAEKRGFLELGRANYAEENDANVLRRGKGYAPSWWQNHAAGAE